MISKLILLFQQEVITKGYSLITPAWLSGQLDAGNVVITTTDATNPDTGSGVAFGGVTTHGGDIAVLSAITHTSGTNSLTLTASDQIRTSGAGTITIAGDLILNAGDGGISAGTAISAGSLTTNSTGTQTFTKDVTASSLDFTTTLDGSSVGEFKYQVNTVTADWRMVPWIILYRREYFNCIYRCLRIRGSFRCISDICWYDY